MAANAAALLDELMGRNRNALPSDRTKELSYNDAEVCRYFLVRFCPHDLFHNTKADLGPCPNLHDEALRSRYQEEAALHTRIKFEDEFLKYCRTMLNEAERKIQKGEQRLAQSQAAKQEATANPKTKIEEQIQILTDKINQSVREAERLGIEGNVEQAQSVLEQCDRYKLEREALKKGEGGSFSAELMVEKQMEVCKVCGAFLIVGDAPARLDDHMQGKQHVGYQKLRNSVEEITESREKARQEREKQRLKEIEERRRRHDEHSSRGSRAGDSRGRSHRDGHRGERDRERSHRSRSPSDRSGHHRRSGDHRDGSSSSSSSSRRHSHSHHQHSHHRDERTSSSSSGRDKERRIPTSSEQKARDRSRPSNGSSSAKENGQGSAYP